MSGLLSVAEMDAGAVVTTSLLDYLSPPPRPFTVRLWNGLELPGTVDACLALNHLT